MLRTRNAVGQYIHVHRKTGEAFDTRNDLTVFIPDNGEWACTIEGSPDEAGRCLIIKSLDELWKVYEALAVAIDIFHYEMQDDYLPPVPGDERNTGYYVPRESGQRDE